jgi:cytochrome c-type biogenesis protein CcmF
MHIIAFASLLLAMLLCLGMGAWTVYALWKEEDLAPVFAERVQIGVFCLMSVASIILTTALIGHDFSFHYVADYTDRFLPLFYRVTAFWAGQSGSFLFWVLMIGLFGVLWIFSARYKGLSSQTKGYFWLFFLGIQAFFLLLLTGPANPFLKLVPTPPDGSGLNPLLQDPGMVFHPPILFMGYAGFAIPACLALAAVFAQERTDWLEAGRNWVLLSWIYLSVGILLGAWWAYMELGWGGYWAWDPVENASLVPWLTSSAFLHTALLGRQRSALHRTNVLLIGVTLLLCFFATYIVRSGIIDSVHAFGARGVGVPLLGLLTATLVLTVWASVIAKPGKQTLGGGLSRPGLLVIVALILGLLGVIVLLGTMWPVISSLWSASPMGLDARFYNTATLPFFVLVTCLLALCPWVSWKEGIGRPKMVVMVLVLWAGIMVGLWIGGIRQPLALLGAGSACAVLITVILLFISERTVRKSRRQWGVYGAHAGLALIVLGVAFSGPFKTERQFVLEPGRSMMISGYEVTYVDLVERATPAMRLLEARLEVSRDGSPVGTMAPQRRLYRNFDQPYAQVSVIPSLGNEIYSTLLAVTEGEVASFKVSVLPLVNWIWIGSTLMCLAAFLCLVGTRRRDGTVSPRRSGGQ